MKTSVYRSMASLRRRAQRRHDGWAPGVGRGIGLLVVVALLLPLVRSSLLDFLTAGRVGVALDQQAEVVARLAGAWLRAGYCLVVWTGFAVYGEVLRGRVRAVLGHLPVDPVGVVWAGLEDVLRRTVVAWLVVMALSAPVAWELSPVAWAMGGAVWAGMALLGLLGAALAVLGSVAVAESPNWAPLLDLVRGNNPRPQAAILYALVPSTAVAFVAGLSATDGAVSLLYGEPDAALALAKMLAPAGLAFVAGAALPRLVQRTWFQASVVLAEIQARYAAVEDPEELRAVYAEWMVRGLPVRLHRWVLLELRQGWRAQRPWLLTAWLVALAGVVVGWSSDPVAGGRAAAVAATVGWVVAAAAVRGGVAEGRWISSWLHPEGGVRSVARTVAVLCWTAWPVVVVAAAVGVRQGLGAAGVVLGAGLFGSVLAGAVAALCSQRRWWMGYTGMAVVAVAVGLAGGWT